MTVPVMQRNLDILSHVLRKGVAHTASSDEQAALISARLVDDMEGLTFQIQRLSDTCKFLGTRVAGVANEKMEDNEKTFDDMLARIEKTKEFLKNITPGSMGAEMEEKDVVLRQGTPQEMRFTAARYVSDFALPNFWFHFTTAYCILRSRGVSLGKFDFLLGQEADEMRKRWTAKRDTE